MYQIEVRATSEEYDVHAHQLAREIVALPTRQVPSLAAISASTSPLVIRTAQLYYLTGNLTPSQVNQLTRQLLIDPVIQEADMSQQPEVTRAEHIVDVFFHPGVTDTLAESVLTGASMLGITGLERVETGKRYLLDQRLSQDEVRTITGEFLYNPFIQHFTLQNNSVYNPVIQDFALQNNGVGADLSRPQPIYRPLLAVPVSRLIF
jgi:phosphoribosylformylglycinamidine synthase subunit PurSL